MTTEVGAISSGRIAIIFVLMSAILDLLLFYKSPPLW